MFSRDEFARAPRDVSLTFEHVTAPQLIAFSASCAAWFALQFLVGRYCSSKHAKFWSTLDARSRAEITVRAVAGCFGAVSSVWAFALLVMDGGRGGGSTMARMFAPEGSVLRDSGETLFAMACGYFVWDVVVSVIEYNNYGFALLVHACASLAAFTVPQMMPKGFLYEFGAKFLLWEITAPFLGARTIMIKTKRTDGWGFRFVERAGFTLFFAVRFFHGLPAMATVIYDIRALRARGLAKPVGVYNAYAAAAVLFPLMNFLWVYKMLRVLLRGKTKKSV